MYVDVFVGMPVEDTGKHTMVIGRAGESLIVVPEGISLCTGQRSFNPRTALGTYFRKKIQELNGIKTVVACGNTIGVLTIKAVASRYGMIKTWPSFWLLS